MKQELHPAAIVGIIVVVVALLVVFGSRALKPAAYEPSPGVVNAKGDAPGSRPGTVQNTVDTENAPATVAPAKNTYYPAAPAGSIPGRPVNSGQ